MGLKLTMVGHATVMVESEAGTRVLIDPWITDNHDSPWTVETLPAPDLILVSHAAFDHLGDALELMNRFPDALLLCGRDVRAWAKRKGIPMERMKVMVMGFHRQERDLWIRTVETRHGSFIDDGDMVFGDHCYGYIISDDSQASVYHMGDTSIFSDLKLIGELYQPQVALIPVGSAPGSLSEMSPVEAAMAAAWTTREIAIPIHYVRGEQDHLVSAWQEALKSRSPNLKTLLMSPGQTLRIDGPDR